MAKFKPYFEVDINKDYSPEERRAIAAEIIDRIVSRTEEGISANGRKFPGYSKLYSKEKGQDNVDLTFSGDMLAEIKLLNDRSGKIRLGYEDDYDGVGKVEGNVLGTYGKDTPIKGKARNFLGITDKELKSILSNYPLKDKEARADRVANLEAADIVSRDILSRSGFGEDDGE